MVDSENDEAGTRQWQQSGCIWLWRYQENTRNYPGWHFTADDRGGASLIALLHAFDKDGPANFRTVQLDPPSARILSVPNNRQTAWVSPSKMRLTLAPSPDEWRFTERDNIATFSIGKNWIPALVKAIRSIASGDGDFSIGPAGSSDRLSIWWCNV